MGFPSAQYSVRVVPFAPVEYLTYGIPPSPIFGGVMVPRKRNRLFLGRFKGVCKGARAPTRIQRSDSCGKRRNNGTDDACPPQAADRMRDVEFVPTQSPLDYAFFRPSTALSFPCGKESGVENAFFLTSQKKVCRRRHPAPSVQKSGGFYVFRFPRPSGRRPLSARF